MKLLIVSPVVGICCALASLIASAEEELAGRHIKPCVVITGADSHVKVPRYLRITSTDNWMQVWLEHKGYPPKLQGYNQYHDPFALPLIDFDKFMVIAIFQGNSINSFGLRVVSISEEDKRIVFRFDDKGYQTLHSTESGEGANEVTAYGFFILPRSTKLIVLEENVQSFRGQPPVWKVRIFNSFQQSAIAKPQENKGDTHNRR